MEELQVDYVDGKFYVYLTLTENLEKAELTDDGYGIRVHLKSRKFEVKLPHQCKEIEKVEEVSPLMYLIVAKPRYPELLPSKPFTYEEDEDDLPSFGPHVVEVEETVQIVNEEEKALDEWIEKELEKFEKKLEEEESRELEKTLLEEEEEEEEGYEFYEKPFEDDEDEWDQGVTELGYEEEP